MRCAVTWRISRSSPILAPCCARAYVRHDPLRRRLSWDVLFRRSSWVAQRRFDTLPVETSMGAMYPCVGVYTLNGRACGAYARLARTEVVDFSAVDVALLVED